MLDLDGIIQDVTLSDTVSGESVDDWRGRPWMETVGDGVGGKLRVKRKAHLLPKNPLKNRIHMLSMILQIKKRLQFCH